MIGQIISISAHLNHGYYKKAQKEFEYLKFSCHYNITAVSGNSLGGGYALNLAQDYSDLRIIGLNPSPSDTAFPYIEHEGVCLLLSSSDVLSRALSCDINRMQISLDEALNLKRIERKKRVYKLSPYLMNRSVPYTSEANISIGHVGALRSYREMIEHYYNDNNLYYNAKIISSAPDKITFSKLLLKERVQKLERDDYLLYTDQFIEPNLLPFAQDMVNNFKLYPQMDEFLSYDLKDLTLLNDNGENNTGDYTISNIKTFSDHLNLQIDAFFKTFTFYSKSSETLLESLNFLESSNYIKRTFLTHSLKIKLDWDWNMLKMIVGVPLNVKLKMGELLEKNWSFFYQLSNQLNDIYQKLKPVADPEINKYTEALNEALERINDLYKGIDDEYAVILNNFELLLLSNHDKVLRKEIYLKDVDFVEYNLNDLDDLSMALMSQQVKDTKESLRTSVSVLGDNVDILSNGMTEVITELLVALEKDLENPKSKKLYDQFTAMKENIDFKAFFTLFLVEFEDEIIHMLLKNSISHEVMCNLIQVKESLESHKRLILNLKHYCEASFNQEKQDFMNESLNRNLEMINNLENLIDIIIN